MGKYQIRNLQRRQIEEAIDEWVIGQHGERNRAIVRRKLFDGITYEQLAEEFNLSVRRTKTIVYRCYDIIFRHIPG